MKRLLLKQSRLSDGIASAAVTDYDSIPEIRDYIARLRLLGSVPFSYLVADEALLPPESIRFFCMDENWLDALTDGALSVGRCSRQDAGIDHRYLRVIADGATQRLSCPRYEKMHVRHRLTDAPVPVTSDTRTGFLLRSALVRKWKAMELTGYHDAEQLNILRMESLSEDILICIFDGMVTKIVISEPKTGLRFGAADDTGVIFLRNISDDENFGNLTGQSIDLNCFTEPNGRLRAADLAREFESKLAAGPVDSARFAFELIATAQRVEFRKGER